MDNPALEKHRFNVSESSSKKLKELKLELDKFKTERPQIVGMTLFGSQTKGTATEDSDFDGYLFMDVEGEENSNVKVYPLRNDSNFEQLNSTVATQFRNRISERFGLTEEQAREIRFRLLSKARIDTEIDEIVQYTKDFARDPKSTSFTIETAIYQLFHMQLGKGLEPYRAYILERFKAEGEWGDRAVAALMEDVEMHERNFTNNYDDKIFPQTVEGAIKRFNLEQVQPKYSTPDVFQKAAKKAQVANSVRTTEMQGK